ncbi:glycosyl transferase family 4 [Candidatus Pacearchaeota archaeon]|nr:glycosyl transferase family 4 [Candidatus Pacearchaeota archaeon]
MEPILLIPIAISFLTVILLLPSWIKKARRAGLLWRDMNKHKKSHVAGSGGIIVISGLIFGILAYIAIHTFYFKGSGNAIEIFALTTSILILAGIGLIDDLLGWIKGGLRRRLRMALCLFAAIPLIVINSGISKITLPFLGAVDIGVLYIIVAIPLGIVATSTTFNFLAGFNGLETGQGIMIFSALALVTYVTGNAWLSFISLLVVISLLGFWFFNKYPAKVFPGDVMTYPIGGLIAIIAILGNIEKIAIIFFIPYILEVILKVRGRLMMHSFGKPDKNNNLDMPYSKVYGLEHLAILILKKFRKKVTERGVVYVIHAFQLIFIIIGLLIMKNDFFM